MDTQDVLCQYEFICDLSTEISLYRCEICRGTQEAERDPVPTPCRPPVSTPVKPVRKKKAIN
jgi:hypothetical protein